MKLFQKICLITGGGSGIGQATAKLFAHEGAIVIIIDKHASNAQKVLSDITEEGGSGLFIKCDVSRALEVRRALNTIKKRFKKLDVLVNNAGVYPQEAKLDATSEALWNDVLAVNLTGPFLLSKHALPLLKRSRAPAIINIASVLGLVPEEGSAAYCVSKAGLIMLTKVAAQENAPRIRVNAICPGPIDTLLLRSSFPTQKDLRSYAKKQTLYGRLGTPDEVARVALFLASDDASYVTGAVWTVDGGESIA